VPYQLGDRETGYERSMALKIAQKESYVFEPNEEISPKMKSFILLAMGFRQL
jgi:hypothetical protein